MSDFRSSTGWTHEFSKGLVAQRGMAFLYDRGVCLTYDPAQEISCGVGLRGFESRHPHQRRYPPHLELRLQPKKERIQGPNDRTIQQLSIGIVSWKELRLICLLVVSQVSVTFVIFIVI